MVKTANLKSVNNTGHLASVARKRAVMQKLANSFCKAIDNKYLVSHSYSTLPFMKATICQRIVMAVFQ